MAKRFEKKLAARNSLWISLKETESESGAVARVTHFISDTEEATQAYVDYVRLTLDCLTYESMLKSQSFLWELTFTYSVK